MYICTLNRFLKIFHRNIPKSLVYLLQKDNWPIDIHAGIVSQNINLKKRELLINRAMTWPKRMPPILAPCAKTGEEKRVYINDAMYGILSKRISYLKSGCDLIFHKDGKALRYNHIQRNYNKALQAANVGFTGTHILRHGMATTTRHLLGLNHSQAVTGHKSIRMLEHYAENNNFELNKESVIHVEKFLNEKLSEAKIVTNCDHRSLKLL